MLSPAMTALTVHLDGIPHRELVHPAGGIGVLIDHDAQIVVTEPADGEGSPFEMVLTRYAPDGGVDSEDDFLACSRHEPESAAQAIREHIETLNVQEQIAALEISSAARKARADGDTEGGR